MYALALVPIFRTLQVVLVRAGGQASPTEMLVRTRPRVTPQDVTTMPDPLPLTLVLVSVQSIV